jgi:hypothetical protein
MFGERGLPTNYRKQLNTRLPKEYKSLLKIKNKHDYPID